MKAGIQEPRCRHGIDWTKVIWSPRSYFMCRHLQPISGDSRGHIIGRKHPVQGQSGTISHEFPGGQGDTPLPTGLFEKTFLFLFFYLMCVYHVYAGAHGDQKRPPDALKLRLASCKQLNKNLALLDEQ